MKSLLNRPLNGKSLSIARGKLKWQRLLQRGEKINAKPNMIKRGVTAIRHALLRRS